jgi:hypothetical protein
MAKLITSDNSLLEGIALAENFIDLKFFDYDIKAEKFLQNGFKIIKNDKNFVINYSTKASFYNALGILLAINKEYSKTKYNGKLGVMLDCARNAVPTVNFLKEYIKKLAFMGYDYIGLYLEDCFEVENEPYFGYKRGRYTKNELKEIIAYSKIFGIEVVPFIQTLAHLNAIFKWEEYKNKVQDINDILLLKEERTYILIENIIKTVAEIFETDRVNIGMDEAHMLGLGKFLEKYGVCNRYELMLEHIKIVLQLCKKYNLKAEMWSDMFFRLAFKGEYYALGKNFEDGFEKIVPSDVKLVYWDYYHQYQKDYEEMLQKHYKLSVNIGFAGGAWTWMGVTPFNGYSMITSKSAINACKKFKVDDIVITMWGDIAGECSFNAVAPTLLNNTFLIYDKRLTESDKNKISNMLFGYTFKELLAFDLPNSLKKAVANNSSFWMMYQDVLLNLLADGIHESYGDSFKKIASKLKKLSLKKSEYNYLFDTLYKFTNCLEIKSVLGLQIKTAYENKNIDEIKNIANKKIPVLIKRLEIFLTAMQYQWLKEKKSFGLDSINIRLGGLIYQLKFAAKMLNDFSIGKILNISELEEINLKYLEAWTDNIKENSAEIGSWTAIMTNSRIIF